MSEQLQSLQPDRLSVSPPVSPRQHPLWKRKERLESIQYCIPVVMLSALLFVPALHYIFNEAGLGLSSEGAAASPASATVNIGHLSAERETVAVNINNGETSPLPAKFALISLISWSLIAARVADFKAERQALRNKKKVQLMSQGLTEEAAVAEIERLEELNKCDRFETLPDDHPLCAKVREYGRQTGVEVHEVRLDSVPAYRNAYAYRMLDEKAVISFRGNPLLLSDGEIILKGVTAHELAHIKRKSSLYESLIGLTALIYGGAAVLSGAVALLDQSSFTARAILGTSLAVLSALPFLSRWQSRNDEALTDLEGAAMINDPAAVIIDNEYLENHKSNGKDWAPSEADKFKSLYLLSTYLFGSTHPPMKERTENLRIVFCIHKNNAYSQPTVKASALQP